MTDKKKDKRTVKIADLIDDKAKEIIAPSVTSDEHVKTYIESHRYDHNNKPNPKDSILWYNSIEIGSRSNIVAITGKAKSRKTAILSAIISTMFKRGNNVLGFTADLDDDDELLHIDTEQSYKDYYEGIERAVRDAGLDLAPKKFTSIFARDAEVELLSAIVEYQMKKLKPRVVFLDGITDFALDINDHKESSRLGRLILKWSTDYDALFILIIHTTKTTGFMTGALGTWFEKKSETVIKVEKPDDQQQISNVSCQYSRDKPFDPFTITFDNTLNRYVKVDESEIVNKGAPSKYDPAGIAEDVHERVLRKLFLLASSIPDTEIVHHILTHVRNEVGSSMTKTAATKWRDFYRDKSRIYCDPQNNWNLITAPEKKDPAQDDLPF